MPKIILIGFMAAGKTTAARAMAQKHNLEFFDSDFEIEKNAGKSIAEIFNEEKEPGFRARETEIFTRILADTRKNCIVAAGGGLILQASNRSAISDEKIVFLDTDFNLIEDRLRGDSGIRPLIRDLKPQQLHVLYRQRRKKYLEYAGYVVNNTDELNTLITKLMKQENQDEA